MKNKSQEKVDIRPQWWYRIWRGEKYGLAGKPPIRAPFQGRGAIYTLKIGNCVSSFNVNCGRGKPLQPQNAKGKRQQTAVFDMAIYYFKVKTVCRAPKHGDSINTASGSSVQKAAYMTCKTMTDERTGITHNFQHGRSKKFESTIDLGINFSDGTKIYTKEKDRHNAYSDFWSKVEIEEKRKDARTARNIILALPYELDKEKNKRLVQEYTDHLTKTYGCAVHAAIHLDDSKNPHAHLLMTTRIAHSNGTFGEKIRILDTPKTAHFEMDRMRQKWMELNNAILAPYGVTLDHRSYKRQGSTKKAQTHQGPAQHHMRKKEIEALEEKINAQKPKEETKMENTLKPKAKKAAPPPPKKAPDRTPQAPPLPQDKARALYRFHHAEAAKIKKGKSPQEIANLTALRIRACGHSPEEAAQIMADDPHMESALMGAYSTGSAERIQKLTQFAPQMKAQERQALAEKTPQTQTQQKETTPCLHQHSSAPAM